MAQFLQSPCWLVRHSDHGVDGKMARLCVWQPPCLATDQWHRHRHRQHFFLSRLCSSIFHDVRDKHFEISKFSCKCSSHVAIEPLFCIIEPLPHFHGAHPRRASEVSCIPVWLHWPRSEPPSKLATTWRSQRELQLWPFFGKKSVNIENPLEIFRNGWWSRKIIELNRALTIAVLDDWRVHIMKYECLVTNPLKTVMDSIDILQKQMLLELRKKMHWICRMVRFDGVIPRCLDHWFQLMERSTGGRNQWTRVIWTV